MKSLVLLYRNIKSNEVTIREFQHIEENNKHYLFGMTNWLGNRVGVLKKYVGQIHKFDYYHGEDFAKYPIVLPNMHDKCYFIFINKNKYNENPLYYYDMIKNYEEE